MERDKELQQAAEAYASIMCNNCSARLYCEEKNKKCAEYREQVNIYADAVKWADEQPKNVCHSAEEEPAGRDWRILCEDESGNCWVASRYCVFSISFNWEEYALDKALARWVYIKDLIPKGGKV